MKAPGNPSNPPPKADFSTVEAVQRQLVEASEALSALTESVALARQVREFAGDRRKRALALSVREFLADESAAAAETRGRASVAYGEALDGQAKEYAIAERVIAEHEATRIRWESARSVLSSLRTIAANV